MAPLHDDLKSTSVPDWRVVGHTINGYDLWGSFEACANISRHVGEHLRAGRPLGDFSLDELLTFLFFSARAERHGGYTWDQTPEQDAVLAEIIRRRGEDWLRYRVEHSTALHHRPRELATGKETPPTERCFWVVPGNLAGGAYPPLQGERVDRLLEAGIRTFISLVEEHERNNQGERFTPYAEHARKIAESWGEQATCLGFPIRDLSVPSEERMQSILDAIDLSLAAKRPVFVHCYGGVGRTGTVIGCWLRRHRMANAENVLDVLHSLRQADEARRHRRAPETAEQVEMVLRWEGGR